MMANQHHRPLSSTMRLDRLTQLTNGHPWHHEYPQTARMNHQKVKKKQPAEADQLSKAKSDTKNVIVQSCSLALPSSRYPNHI